jgi:hypothetical protein
MLRAIVFVDCDFCHESHSDIRSITGRDDSTWNILSGDLEHSALADGWCHCLIEGTGEYKIMCNSCQAEHSLLNQIESDWQDSEF